MLGGLQQFEDVTNEELHTLNEELSNISGTAHTHENKAVLDSFTRADKTAIDSLPAFKSGVAADLQELRESVSTVVEQAHWHHNLTVLNSLTSAKVNKWDGYDLQLQSLQGNIMDYQMQMNHRMDEADSSISALESDVQQLRDSTQYEIQSTNDELTLLGNRVGNIESTLDGVDAFLSRVVG